MKTPVDSATPIEAPRYWRSLEERDESPEARRAAEDEFLPGAVDPEDPPPVDPSRRDFLSLVAATATLAASAACDRKGQGTVVPYTKRPVEIVPGVANHYASTFQEGRRAYPVLVKTREGRPIHVTGNDEHPSFKGKTSPRAVAEVMGLYDPDRLRGPKLDAREVSWAQAESRLLAAAIEAKTAGKPVLLLTGALSSPTRKALVAELKSALPVLEHLAWEAAESGAAQDASKALFGVPLEVKPRLDTAKVILSLGADFLNGDDPESIAAFMATRRPTGPGQPMNRLWALEGALTLTGSNADHRFPVKPSRLAALAFALARDLNAKHGLALPAGTDLSAVPAQAELPAESWERLQNDLISAGRAAAVLCGEGMPTEAHQAAHLLNAMLGSRAVDLRPSESLASVRELEAARQGMAEGRYAAVLFWGVNPAFAFPRGNAWQEAVNRVPFRAWIGLQEDETSAQCQLLLPQHHWLEAWGDFGEGGIQTLQQPTVGALYDTRQGEDVLLTLLRGLGAQTPPDYHAYLQARWRKEVFPAASLVPFDRFFQAALHDGLARAEARPASPPALHGGALTAAAGKAAGSLADATLEVVLFPGTQVHDGRYANNGWLQECPDPVTKMTWGNPLSVSVADGKRLGLKDGDVVRLEANGATLALPVVLQPGLAKGVLALALGYGRRTGTLARGKGSNAFPLVGSDPSSAHLCRGAKLTPTGAKQELARTQSHHRMEGRDLVRSFTLAEFAHESGKHPHEPELFTLYPEQAHPDHKWGMVIDLSVCVGCSGCVVACTSENNVPVVGPEQVAKGREMHWIRLDRYYEGDEDNPKVVQQPMLCQHCDDAPCENVCPVNATNHSPDGLNQMAYNRCVGTRYCANNCPYKVRRFNFLEYTAHTVEPASLVYNPEVTVRPRGVMEKCTFCVQRIQDGRMRAKGDNRPLLDGDIVPACAAACPSEAIVFGDLKDPKSRVSIAAKSRRGYKVLEEVGARPAITYLADLRNPVEGGSHAG
jgi:molybdopterin-containing oxidoreductase family iron-sulfur binding subunit